MTNFKLLGLALLLVATPALAGDYLRVSVDRVPAGADSFEIPFYIERTCPDPSYIMGVSNGFVLNATGDATWEYAGYQPCPQHLIWFNLGGLVIYRFSFDGIPPDWFWVGMDMPGEGRAGGLPIVEDTFYFSLFLDIGPGEGEILIDSAFTGSAGVWKWAGLTCGQGGEPTRPLFVDKFGSDAHHPIHIEVYEPPCGDANEDGSVDIDDPVFLVNYIFMFGPAPDPLIKADCDCSGGSVPVDIDDVVHLMNYILRGGPEPCDLDGDDVPDC
jgi:hypothetical protein